MQKISPDNPYSTKYDLTNCDKEPIHQIQTVQSFAAIIAVDLSNWTICQVSSNLSRYIEFEHKAIIGKSLSDLLPELIDRLKKGVELEDFSQINPLILNISAAFPEKRIVVAHVNEDRLILEIENVPEAKNNLTFFNKIDKAIQRIQFVDSSKNLFKTVAEEVRNITGYDRVMIYQFDPDYNGEVIAEVKNEELEPFLGIHYPSTDIPKQARKLFLTNRVRMLTDVDDDLSMIYPTTDPKTDRPLNVGGAAARGVSPIHLEYLRNMGVRATLNVAIVENEKLWGLIACHHYQKPKILTYRTRMLIRFMGQIISGHLSLQRANEFRKKLLNNNIVHAKLFEQMNEKRDLISGLTKEEITVLDYIPASGAAIIFDKKIETLGNVPSEERIWEIANHLSENEPDILFSTDSLKNKFPDKKFFTDDCAGMLSVRISGDPEEYIIWFRKPQAQEVFWGGNPDKAVINNENSLRLSPRKSFEKWKQVVENCSEPWKDHETDAAILLRNDIKEVILKRFSELRKLHADLQNAYKELDTFSYTVSHDLRSPLRAIEGFSQILLEDYMDKLDDYGVNVVNTIVSSVNKMDEFVKNILVLSKLAKESLVYSDLDVRSILDSIVSDLKNEKKEYKSIKFIVADNLPKLSGHQTMIYSLFQNLIGNAFKYSSKREDAYVEVGGKKSGGKVKFYVKDNGIGFDTAYTEKIFEVFRRLVSEREFEGTGVGLSIVKRIVDRHQGEIKVQSEKGKGSTFQVIFPVIKNV